MDTDNRPPGRRTARWKLPADPSTTGLARTLTARTLHTWSTTLGTGTGTAIDPAADLDDIVLMVDELVTNAVVHGRGPVRLRLTLDGARLTAEIGDDDPTAPAPPGRGPCQWAEGGRGLLLVGALASAFGTRPDGHGKTVWFTRDLTTTPAPRPAPAPATAPPAGTAPLTST